MAINNKTGEVMKDNRYSKIKKELPSISKVVKLFPEQLQSQVLEILLKGFWEEDISDAVTGSDTQGLSTFKGKGELPGIATLNDKGEFYFTLRDPKAISQNDAVKRLTYVAIRSFLQLKKGESKVSRKKIINPILSEWRVYDGNARNFLANDKGLIREGDLLSLDVHATKEADKFIKDISDQKTVGSWSPSSVRTRKRTKHDKKVK